MGELLARPMVGDKHRLSLLNRHIQTKRYIIVTF